MKKLKNYTSNLFLCIKIMFTISPANFLLKLFCSFIVPVISLVMVYLMKWMLDYLVNYNESIFYKITELLVIYFILKVANIIITNIERYAEEVNNSNIRRYINNLIITRCTELDISIYDDASWFIFDEPSSALDPKIEYEFFQRIREASKNKTIIYISHRLSNITFSDKIIVMEKGKVIESGNIDQLMFNKGKFYELYNYQKSFLS